MTSDPAPGTRPLVELPWSDVEFYVTQGFGVTIPLNGGATAAPRVNYVIGDDGDVTLQVELTGGAGGLSLHSALPLIEVHSVHVDGRRVARIRCTEPSLRREFHDLLCAIAERIVEGGQGLADAFDGTVRAWSALVRSAHGLSMEKRIGLIGELAVLAALASSDEGVGREAAVQAWVGAHREEHDFALPAFDVEVKTTASERRAHVVHGSGQLTPKPGRPLWLVSLQLTRGGSTGATLTGVVTAAHAAVATDAPQHLTAFERRLASVGWDEQLATVHDDERWVLRGPSVVLPVDARLPRIDAGLLAALGPDRLARFSDLSYRIDLTGLPADPSAPAVLHDLQLP